MSRGPTQIASKGACIYCKRADVRLTDEHILPLALGGVHVIKEGSCQNCAKITSKFELDVARHMWGDARKSYGGVSRRRKRWEKNITLDDIKTSGEKINIPFDEYPAGFVFYLMKRAGSLIGLSEDIDQSKIWEFRVVADDDRMKKFEKRYPGRLTIRFKHVPDSFARLLAKIGYGQILCSLDPEDFEPICLPYILGTKANPSYLVGGRWTIPPPSPGIGYEMSTNCVVSEDKLLLIAEIRLYANVHSPVYHVVVGRVRGPERVAHALGKVQATCIVAVTDANLYAPPMDDKFHWLPRVWPPSLFHG